jgi:mono/diheme cytochrome c family protein
MTGHTKLALTALLAVVCAAASAADAPPSSTPATSTPPTTPPSAGVLSIAAPPNTGPPMFSATSPTARRIAIPHDEPELPAFPGRDVFVSNCVICHSPRYVSGQPNFPRVIWTAEVNKMIKVYGAPIAPEDVPKIVDYLVPWNGQEDKKP